MTTSIKIPKRLLLLPSVLLALACTLPAPAQMAGMAPPAAGKPKPSPAETATGMIGGKSVVIKYGAPSLRGRKMIGDHEPYGKVWRTGANEATTLIAAGDLKIGTLDVPAGTYTIYSVPAAPGTPWMLIVNKETGQWGTEYTQAKDLGRTPMTAKTLGTPQEKMSISFENVKGKTGELHLRWGDLDEFVKVEAK